MILKALALVLPLCLCTDAAGAEKAQMIGFPSGSKRSKYVESGLWDGHFRDSDAREGLVLRAPSPSHEPSGSSTSSGGRPTYPTSCGRFGRPLGVPRWPFAERADRADRDRADRLRSPGPRSPGLPLFSESTHMAHDPQITQETHVPSGICVQRTLDWRTSDCEGKCETAGAPTDFQTEFHSISSGVASAINVQQVQSSASSAQRARAQELLCQLAAHRREAELRIARVWASAIKDGSIGSTASADSKRDPEAHHSTDLTQRHSDHSAEELNLHNSVSNSLNPLNSHQAQRNPLLTELAMLRAKMREELAMLEADAEAVLWCRDSSHNQNPLAVDFRLQQKVLDIGGCLICRKFEPFGLWQLSCLAVWTSEHVVCLASVHEHSRKKVQRCRTKYPSPNRGPRPLWYFVCRAVFTWSGNRHSGSFRSERKGTTISRRRRYSVCKGVCLWFQMFQRILVWDNDGNNGTNAYKHATNPSECSQRVSDTFHHPRCEVFLPVMAGV